MTHDFNLLQVMSKGGWTIGILVILSIVVVAVFIERIGFYRKALGSLQVLLETLSPTLNRANFKEALEVCDKLGGFLGHIARSGILAKMEKADPVKAMEREAKIQLLELERRLPFLATIGSIATVAVVGGLAIGAGSKLVGNLGKSESKSDQDSSKQG